MSQYIAAFNKALNWCCSILPDEMKFLFEKYLWKEIALQWYNANCTILAESQTAAQQAGLVFLQVGVFDGRDQGFSWSKWKHRSLYKQNQGKT